MVYVGEKTIKQMSKEAKKRLSTGFWERVQDEHEQMQDKSPLDVSKYLTEKVQRSILTVPNSEEEMLFRKKVEEIIDNEDCITNPLRLLMDDTVVENLDFNARGRYVLSISERYLKVHEQILAERELQKRVLK